MSEPTLLQLSACAVDLARQQVLPHDGAARRLTTREADLLEYLARRRSETVSRDELLREVWGYHDQVLSRAADNAVRRLREKIEADPSAPVHLLTVFGVGYRFEAGDTPLEPVPVAVAEGARPPVKLGDVVIDLRRQWIERGATRYPLTATDSDVLAVLLDAAGRCVRRQELLRRVWNRHSPHRTRVVDNAVARLRSKLEDDPSHPRHLLTVRGRGYRLAVTDAPSDPVAPLDEGGTFVGRAAELAALAQALEATRLVCLVGPPGVGKTRLSRRFVHEGHRRAWWCDVTRARDQHDVWNAVAAALDVSAEGDEAVAAGVARRLDHARGLLVVDNAEGAAEAVGRVLTQLRDATSGAWLLATSRRPLAAASQRVIEVDPLPAADAVALFVDRARTARSDVSGPEHRDHIERIVEVLDRLPLAIELSARRVGLMSPRRLLDRLGSALSLQGPDQDARHRTLRAAIAWSWSLLGDDERAVLSQLAVFGSPFSIESAEGVVTGVADVVEAVQRLREHHLLFTTPDPVRPGEVRLALFEAVRQFCDDQLSSEARRRIEQRVVAWFAQYGEREALDALWREGGVALSLELLAELDHFVAATELAFELGDGPAAARTALAAIAVLRQRGPASAGVDLGRRALAMDGLDFVLRARLGGTVGDLLRNADRWDEADVQVQEALGYARAAGDAHEEAILLFQLGMSHADRFHVDEARSWFEACVAVAETAAVDWVVHFARGRVAMLAPQVDLDEVERHHRAALAAFEANGDRAKAAGAHMALGSLAWNRGQLSEARAHFEHARPVLHDMRARRTELRAVAALCDVLVSQGDHEAHEPLCRELIEAWRDLAETAEVSLNLAKLGHACRLQGRLDEARELLEEARAEVPVLNDQIAVGHFWLRLAELYIDQGDLESASGAVSSALAHLPDSYPRLALAARALQAWLGAAADPDGAADVLAGLVDGLAAHGFVAEPACAQALLGRVHLLRGDVEAARAAWQAASATAARLGAGPRSEVGVAVARLEAALSRARSSG